MNNPYRKAGSPTDCITALITDVLVDQLKKAEKKVDTSNTRALPIFSRPEGIETLNRLLSPRVKVLTVQQRFDYLQDAYMIVAVGPGGEERIMDFKCKKWYKTDDELLVAVYDFIFDQFGS
jgi:hypothetical protein